MVPDESMNASLILFPQSPEDPRYRVGDDLPVPLLFFGDEDEDEDIDEEDPFDDMEDDFDDDFDDDEFDDDDEDYDNEDEDYDYEEDVDYNDFDE
jgi:hypothetical protein